MKRVFVTISTLFIFSILSLNLSAQYGPQLDNRGFEQWTNRVSEPVHWHSGGTATGTWSSMMPNSVEQSSQTRPGSTGSKSVRLVPSSVIGVTANGTVTNGRINAGSMSPSGSSNYNYTQRDQNVYNTPITQLPDSLTVWVCFRSQSTSHKAQVKAVVHGDADYRIIADGSESPANMHVATADQRFTRTAANGGAYNWTRLSIPFVNNGPCTDVRYILFMATTNETPGTGSTNDDLFLDDVLLVYNPSLSMGQLASTSFAPGDAVTIPFTLSGTMSPDNLNATANEVIAQLSNSSGSFNNPTELGRVTTNTSGSITAQIPSVNDGSYQIRVISTNYPMVGQNIQSVSISSPTYTINVSANPNEGGSVTGGGEYSGGQSCTVHATASTGYTFTNWTENGTQVSSQADYTFTVNGNRNLVANFAINSYTISVSADPANAGSVTGGGNYNQGETCTLTATAHTGYTFVNWTKNGTQVSTNPTYSFTVTESASYVAHFSANSYTISVLAHPEDGGTVSGGGTYTYGQSCTVHATTAPGYSFINWRENGNHLTSQPDYTFTVSGDRNLEAHFALQSFSITASADPMEGGSVTGGGSFHYGETCNLTATANTGYTFVNWTKNGTQVSTNATYSFTVTESADYVAHFTATGYVISVSADPIIGGSVSGGGTYTQGQSCTITASANQSYEFINWTLDGTEVSTDASYTFTVMESQSYVAHFHHFEGVEEGGTITQIFPNPFTSVVSITTETIASCVRVYDLFGHLLKEQVVESMRFDLDLDGLSAGAYLLQIDYGDNQSVHRIMKAK